MRDKLDRRLGMEIIIGLGGIAARGRNGHTLHRNLVEDLKITLHSLVTRCAN